MVVLCGQILLHKGIIANLLKKFCVDQLIHENPNTFPPQMICNIWYIWANS